MSSINSIESKHEDFLYYDVVQSNTTSSAIKAEYKTSFAIPLLDKCSNFQGAVIRFSAPGSSLPLFIWKPNLYKLTIRNGDFTLPFPAPVVLSLVNNNDAFADAAAPDFINYVYDYQVLVNSVNTAIKTAFVAFKAMYAGFAAVNPPWLIYDPPSRIFSLIADQKFWTSQDYKVGSTSAQLCFNEPLNSFFPNFQNVIRMTLGAPTSPNAVDDWTGLVFDNLGNNSLVNVTPPFLIDSKSTVMATAFSNPQTYSSLASIIEIRGMIITSNSLPNRPEVIPGLVNTSSGGSSGAPNSLPIVADYVLLSADGTDFTTGIVYNPSAQFRWFDMLSDAELRSIDFSFFWYTGRNNLYPVYMEPREVFTLKICFKRKHEMTSAVLLQQIHDKEEALHRQRQELMKGSGGGMVEFE